MSEMRIPTSEECDKFVELLVKPNTRAFCDKKTLERLRQFPEMKGVIDKFEVCDWIEEGRLVCWDEAMLRKAAMFGVRSP